MLTSVYDAHNNKNKNNNNNKRVISIAQLNLSAVLKRVQNIINIYMETQILRKKLYNKVLQVTSHYIIPSCYLKQRDVPLTLNQIQADDSTLLLIG